LTAPASVIQHRIATRINNPYGKQAHELAEIMHNLKTIEPLLRRRATHLIDTREPLLQVVNTIASIITSPAQPARIGGSDPAGLC